MDFTLTKMHQTVPNLYKVYKCRSKLTKVVHNGPSVQF